MPLIPGSLVACRSTACGSSRVAFQQALNPPPACFSLSLLSLLTSSQVPAPTTTFAQASLFEVCSAKVGPCYFVFHQYFSWNARHPVTITASDDEIRIPINKHSRMESRFRYAASSTSQHNILASGGTLAPMRCSSAPFSVLTWPATSPTARSMIPLDWLFPTGGLWDRLASFFASLCDFPSPLLQSPARCRT